MATKLYMTLTECPYCGQQDVIAQGSGRIIRLFDMRLLNRNYKQALKGQYHTWTCMRCDNRFIRSNVLCDCTGYGTKKGIVIKSKRPRPIFLCSRCRKETGQITL